MTEEAVEICKMVPIQSLRQSYQMLREWYRKLPKMLHLIRSIFRISYSTFLSSISSKRCVGFIHTASRAIKFLPIGRLSCISINFRLYSKRSKTRAGSVTKVFHLRSPRLGINLLIRRLLCWSLSHVHVQGNKEQHDKR